MGVARRWASVTVVIIWAMAGAACTDDEDTAGQQAEPTAGPTTVAPTSSVTSPPCASSGIGGAPIGDSPASALNLFLVEVGQPTEGWTELPRETSGIVEFEHDDAADAHYRILFVVEAEPGRWVVNGGCAG